MPALALIAGPMQNEPNEKPRPPDENARCGQVGLAKNGDEHRRNILQAIFRVRLFEERGVLLQLVSHLINNKGAAVRKRVVRFLQKRALFIDIQDTERNPGQDVIAARRSRAAAVHREGRRRRDCRRGRAGRGKLTLKIPGKRRVQLENKQLCVRPHPTRDLAGMYAFARPVFGDHPRLGEIDLVGNPLNQSARTGNDRSHLKWLLKEAFKE